jgi:hypothetical protein
VRARAALALALMVSSPLLATAQPNIPASELPGRERERFLESPIERSMRPGATVSPPVVELPKPTRKHRARRPRGLKQR